MKVKNFLFHRVSPEKDIMWPPIPPNYFEKIIRYISKKYRVVSLEDFLQTPFSRVNKQLATILFDDGYKDNLEFAAPILQKYSCPASFYVVTDCIDTGIPTWTYIIDFFFKFSKTKTLLLEFNFVPDTFRLIKWQTIDEGKAIAGKIKSWIKTTSNDNRLLVMKAISKQQTESVFPSRLMMSWDDVRELYNKGFYIGSHSHTHPMLASMKTEEEIERELQQSAAIIKSQLGYYPSTISYPIGSWDERVLRLAKKAGYQFGLAVEQRQYDTERDTKLAIPRIELYSEPWWKTRLRINGVYQSVRKLLR